MINKNINKLDIWILPIFFALLMFALWYTDNNAFIFFIINALAIYNLNDFWEYITVLGDALILLSFLAFFLKRFFPWVVTGLIAAIISATVVQLMKHGLDIDRPFSILDKSDLYIIGNPLSHKSFPSGHTASIFVFSTVIFLLAKSKIISALTLLLAIIVGFSRVVIGAHWPLDILAGAIIGWLSVYIAILITSKIKKINKIFHLIIILFILAASISLFFIRTDYENTYLMQIFIATFTTITAFYNLITFHKQK